MNAAVRVACHLAVVLWIGLYLAWRAADVPVTLAIAPPLVRAIPEAPPEAQREPPTDEPAEEVEAAASVGGEEIARGEALLIDGGAFPVLSFSYESFPSFRAYAQSMERLGARFVVVHRRSIVAAVDLDAGLIAENRLGAHFSPRARDYSAEPALAPISHEAQRRFGADAEVMMLVPRRIDAALFGAIARELATQGTGHASYREVRGRYERAPGGGVHLRVQSARRGDGAGQTLDLLLDLGAIAASPPA